MSNEQERKPIKKGDGTTLIIGLVAVVLAILIGLIIPLFGAVTQFERHKKMLAYHKDIPAQTQMAYEAPVESAYDANIAE